MIRDNLNTPVAKTYIIDKIAVNRSLLNGEDINVSKKKDSIDIVNQFHELFNEVIDNE